MAKKGRCKYADRQASGNALHCTILKEENKKWDFCVCQYFCRVSGKYELNESANFCKVKKEAENK